MSDPDLPQPAERPDAPAQPAATGGPAPNGGPVPPGGPAPTGGPVPPGGPAPTGGPVPPASGARGLSIAAMALGLVSLVTVVVAALYFRIGAAPAALLALVAVVLGIVALVRRGPRAPSITGAASGALTLMLALAVGVVSAIALVAPDRPEAGRGGDGRAEAPQSAVVEWPANMAGGGIAFVGDGDRARVVPSDAPADNALPRPLDPAEAGAAHHVRVYLDYRCPYCARFEAANGETLERLIAGGETAVELHPLTFLDRVSAGSAYSSRTAGAMACVASEQPDAAWAAHTALMDADFQPAEGGAGHDDAALVAAIDGAAGGLGEGARSCITEGRFVPFAQALNDWTFANPVPGADDPELMVTGTPLVVVDGVPYAGDPADAAAFRAFLEERGLRVG